MQVNCEFLDVLPDITAREGLFMWRYADWEETRMFWLTFGSLNAVAFVSLLDLQLDLNLIHTILIE